MRVWNKREPGIPKDAVYVGRPTKWGNPFSHLQGTKAQWVVGSREEAVAVYEVWIRNNPEMVAEAKEELRGKDLVCWCAPQRCHADILLVIANE